MLLTKLMKFSEGKSYLSKLAIASSIVTINALAIAPSQAMSLIQNGSFENINGTFVNNGAGFMPLGNGSTVIPGWTTTNPFVAWISDSNGFGVRTPFGTFSPDLKTGSNVGGLAQTINIIITVNIDCYDL